MHTMHHFLKKGKKYVRLGLLGIILLGSITSGFLTYGLSESFIKNQIEYLVSVIDANIEKQNLNQESAKNFYIGLREVYRGAVVVLDLKIGNTPSSSPCSIYTDPVERVICETNQNGGWSGTTNTGSAVCPTYSIATPPTGCTYTYTKDANGCDMPNLVCNNTGSTNTGGTFSCLAKPSFLTTTNAVFTNGTPTTLTQQSWQNSNSSSPCYYSCKSGYSGVNCTNTTVARAGWMLADTNCDIADITVGSQIWAGCNSTLGNGVEYTGTAGTSDLGINTIGGKLYTWSTQASACSSGWKVPSREDFQAAFASLGCQAYNPGYPTSAICPGLGWTGNGNTFSKVLKIPLSGYKDTRFSTNYLSRGSVAYLATSSLYENDTSMRRSINIDKNWDKLDEYASPKNTEYSVRCIKEATTNGGGTGGGGSGGGGTTYSCVTRPSYLTTTNATFVNGTPTSAAQQTWQNLSSSSPCYYACKSGYIGTQCLADSSGGGTGGGGTGGGGTPLGCTRGGVSYIDGDVRCDGNKELRCSNGTFTQIYDCGAGNVCVDNLERTTGGKFYVSCQREYDIYNTDGSYNYITISDAEKATLSVNSKYKCQYSLTTRNYGNCVYQSCTIQAHSEGQTCVSNSRSCSLANTTNGGNQTWSNGAWGTCQPTSSTTCASGYRMIDGACKSGADTCNSPMLGAGGAAKNLLTANGVDVSTKTYGGYAGGGVWTYDPTLSEACTWRCQEGYKQTSEISGWRGSEFCVKKNICDDNEYFDTTWSSSEHANQACDSCKGTMPYGGSSNSTIYTSSTKRGSYANMLPRIPPENQTWKYISNGTPDTLAESCTWSCKSGYIPGYVQAPQSARGPLTCCSAGDSTCVAANL